MELYTLQRELISTTTGSRIKFKKKDTIEGFSSLIWTERYFGNGDVQIVCPATDNYIQKLPKGGYVSIDGSKELMRIQTVQVENGALTINGISILSWLNEARFIRNSKSHKIKSWLIKEKTPGEILWMLLSNAINYNNVLTESNTDIYEDYLEMLKIPEIGLHELDTSDEPVSASVDFGPVYDVMLQVASQYGIGMQLQLQSADEITALGFRTYKGLNRTNTQSLSGTRNPIVSFSKATDSLTGTKEIYSLTDSKTLAFAFGSNLDSDLGKEHGDHNSGIAWVKGMDVNNPEAWGLECKAVQVFADDLSGYPDPLSTDDITELMAVLNLYAAKTLQGSAQTAIVDGQIVSTDTYLYGRDYYLGDLIEIEGDSGLVSIGQVTEYIRAQDATGEQGYPAISLLSSMNLVDTRFDLNPAPNNPHDKAGDAFEIELTDAFKVTKNTAQYAIYKGVIQGTNIDCTNDTNSSGVTTDWLLQEMSFPDDTANWHTTWFKWHVPSDFGEDSKFKAWLTNYDSHMILFAMAPDIQDNNNVDIDLLGPGEVPTKAHQNKYYSFGFDLTEPGDDPPYETIFVWVDSNIWTEPTNSRRWIWIGVASSPLGVWGQKQDRGGNFRLHWQYWENYPTAKKPS